MVGLQYNIRVYKITINDYFFLIMSFLYYHFAVMKLFLYQLCQPSFKHSMSFFKSSMLPFYFSFIYSKAFFKPSMSDFKPFMSPFKPSMSHFSSSLVSLCESQICCTWSRNLIYHVALLPLHVSSYSFMRT